MFSGADLKWYGDLLRSTRSRRPSVSIEPDATYPGMWRIVLPDDTRSDMFNRARAKENAKTILLGLLNVKPDAASAPLQH
jgi:phage protein U